MKSNNLIIANWKSNKTWSQAKSWLDEFQKLTSTGSGFSAEIILAPQHTLLGVTEWYLANHWKSQNQPILAAQDVSPYPAGSYTGAIFADSLKDLSVKYVIVGHSERRRYFHETHQDVANKVTRLLEAKITPVLCVDDEYIAEQAAAIDSDQLGQCVVAYEDLNAIGTGNNEPVAHVKEVADRIKKVFGDVPVIYGGSVEDDNVAGYISICDGVLVGGASLNADSFANLIRQSEAN